MMIKSIRPLSLAGAMLVAILAFPLAARASLIDLGTAAGYGILGLDNSIINLSSGPLRVNSNVGVGRNAALNFSGGGQINGKVNFAASATLNTGGNTISGGTHQVDFAPIQKDAFALSSFADSLAPTRSFSSITSALTITGNGGSNVISIGQDIHLSGGNLTLSGGSKDSFIFNIAGTLEFSGNTNIVLTGGVTGDQVLFNFVGGGKQVQFSGKSDTAGIFLAPDRVINVNGGIHDSEFISGRSLSFQSNPIVNGVPGVTPVPEVTPGSLIFGFAGLVIVSSGRKAWTARKAAQV